MDPSFSVVQFAMAIQAVDVALVALCLKKQTAYRSKAHTADIESLVRWITMVET
jgi:hypothetical protein